MNVNGNTQLLLESRSREHQKLAEAKWARYCRKLNPMMAASTARVLENTQRWLRSVQETSRAVNVGNFDRFAFPLVRATYPSLIAHEIVSVQPMDGPVGLIFYFNILYGSNKGRIQAGQPMFSAQTGHPGDDTYSSDVVESESVGTGDGVTTAFTKTLDYIPVLPNSIEITDGTQTVTGNQDGTLSGHINPAGTNSINYATGVLTVTFATAPTTGAPVTITYRFDNEANRAVPEVDFQMVHAPVQAFPNRLKTAYSLEAAQNLRSLHGLSAETEMVVALSQALRFEIDRQIIKDLFSFAEATSVTWPLAPSTGVTYTEHKLSFVDRLITASNNIFERCKRGLANFLVVGLRPSDVIESLPGFVASSELATQNGVVFAGTLNGRWKVYKDPYNINRDPEQRNILLGFKGANFLDAGFVYAPYIPFYTTPTIVLPDFIAQKGMATQWGKRKVNGNFYATAQVTGQFSP